MGLLETYLLILKLPCRIQDTCRGSYYHNLSKIKMREAVTHSTLRSLTLGYRQQEPTKPLSCFPGPNKSPAPFPHILIGKRVKLKIWGGEKLRI